MKPEHIKVNRFTVTSKPYYRIQLGIVTLELEEKEVAQLYLELTPHAAFFDYSHEALTKPEGGYKDAMDR